MLCSCASMSLRVRGVEELVKTANCKRYIDPRKSGLVHNPRRLRKFIDEHQLNCSSRII